MIKCEELYRIFKDNKIDFYTGVPDSTFADWMKFLADEHGKGLSNIVACNECEAIAISAGYYLATNRIGVVYMQNSGEGKAINPLASLCDSEIYSIPLILMIGWRGEPQEKDEPQHKKMGRIMIPLLETLDIPYKILPGNVEGTRRVITEIKEIAEATMAPVAVIIKKGTIEKYEAIKKMENIYEMTREDALKVIADILDGTEAIISTTGKLSRELFEYRVQKNETPRDFYTVGSMGCSASVALGIALQKPQRNIFIFDGDGAVLMQMGSLATIGHYKPKNLKHVIFDNASHDSTGGQPTVSSTVNFKEIALSCGYINATEVKTREELIIECKKMKDEEGPNLLVVNINRGSRKDLGRPTTSPIQNKITFMNFLKEG
ncbi:MAG: phosphonopyruvate decarboxylase [Spirochaetota bacterium]|nr:phosphonopyruvate decarboxylase [Spirochaetota bacterium]